MIFMWQFMVKKSLAVFIPKDALSVWTNLGKHFVVRLVMQLRKITTLSSGFSDFACLVAVCPCCSIVVHLETT